jgi:hypothetical protein
MISVLLFTRIFFIHVPLYSFCHAIYFALLFDLWVPLLCPTSVWFSYFFITISSPLSNRLFCFAFLIHDSFLLIPPSHLLSILIVISSSLSHNLFCFAVFIKSWFPFLSSFPSLDKFFFYSSSPIVSFVLHLDSKFPTLCPTLFFILLFFESRFLLLFPTHIF